MESLFQIDSYYFFYMERQQRVNLELLKCI